MGGDANEFLTPFSEPPPTRPSLFTVGGGVAVAAAAETAITIADPTRFGYLLVLDAICTVAATASGAWALRIAAGGTVVLQLQQPSVAAAVGSRMCWSFPFPWKTTAVNGVYTVTPSNANMGTWIFSANGFHSSR